MHTFTPKFILAASCFFLHLKSLCAAPVEEVTKTIQVRQYEDGDDELGAITNPLRNAYSYSRSFEAMTPTWYTIYSSGPTATYLPFTVASPKPTALPPIAQSQGQGTLFNVDHVLELQVIGAFVQKNNPDPARIPNAAWNSLRDVVTNPVPLRSLASASSTQRFAIASAIGRPENLAGIPNSPNGSKQAFFREALSFPLIGPTPTSTPPFIKEANRRYLVDRRGGILRVIGPVGEALGVAGSGRPFGTVGQNPVAEGIFDAWSRYALGVYDQARDSLRP